MSNNPFYFNIVVWGTRYTQKLIKYTLPTLLSQNNIPELVKHRDCEFYFITTAADEEVLKQARCFKLLASYLPIHFIHLNETAPPDSTRKWICMSEGHKSFCTQVKDKNPYGIFLMPDMLISDGALLHFNKMVSEGIRAIIMAMVRLIEEEVPPSQEDVLTISGREMVSMIFKSIHAESRSFIFNDPTFQSAPGSIIWRIDGHDIWIVRGLHAQPVVVDLSTAHLGGLDNAFDTTDFVEASIGGMESSYVVPDSDLAMGCSLTPRDSVPTEYSIGSSTIEELRKILHHSNNQPMHKWYFKTPVLYHSSELPPNIKDYVKANEEFVESIPNS